MLSESWEGLHAGKEIHISRRDVSECIEVNNVDNDNKGKLQSHDVNGKQRFSGSSTLHILRFIKFPGQNILFKIRQ